jgi:hypothetical protein
MTFFMEHTMVYFDDVFVNTQGIGLEKYQQVMEHKFWVEQMDLCNTLSFKFFKGF